MRVLQKLMKISKSDQTVVNSEHTSKLAQIHSWSFRSFRDVLTPPNTLRTRFTPLHLAEPSLVIVEGDDMPMFYFQMS